MSVGKSWSHRKVMKILLLGNPKHSHRVGGELADDALGIHCGIYLIDGVAITAYVPPGAVVDAILGSDNINAANIIVVYE